MEVDHPTWSHAANAKARLDAGEPCDHPDTPDGCSSNDAAYAIYDNQDRVLRFRCAAHNPAEDQRPLRIELDATTTNEVLDVRPDTMALLALAKMTIDRAVDASTAHLQDHPEQAPYAADLQSYIAALPKDWVVQVEYDRPGIRIVPHGTPTRED